MPNPLISLRLSPDLIEAVERFAQENELDRTAVIRAAICQYIGVPQDPLEERIERIEDRLDALEASQPLMTAPVRGDYSVEKRVESPSLDDTPVPKGISQNQLMKLCRCGDRKLKAIRDKPEELAPFTLDRTGQVFEFRDGLFWVKR